ncbi:DUF1493 family protein [Serratia sp. UGAL515B_01]|uniref:DUF1493 family protein n=1 Tax=Serratia sp. UGAL515B_01 TaxID=2986763 RepID=UPI002953B114|nr:DUF1493 family protein [Serratia sp. UGAL515B_01]WON76606.1 DUF1493 family protein [Serratia sp. UGAL515B_01]
MNQVTDAAVREFVKSELPLITTLLLKKVDIDDHSTLQELYEADDVAEMIEKYFVHFNVNPADFIITNYFPWKTPFLFFRKPVNQDKTSLTIQMFIDSAKAGRWLY